MPATQQLTITLPNETAEAVKSKVASGEFANESNVINAGVLHLILDEVGETQGMSEEAFRDWLRTEAVPVLDAMKTDPARGRAIEQVRARLAKEHANMKARGTLRFTAVLMLFFSSILLCQSAIAQGLECSLGKVSERVPPRYPIQLDGRIVEGDVNVLATFAPDGRVSSSKVISGPQAFQFEARAYLNGWRAEPAADTRQCIIHLKYRFDGSQAACTKNREVGVRAERLSDTDVLLHLSCGGF